MKPFVPLSLPLMNIDWSRLIEPVGEARAALGRYAGILEGVPEPDVLLAPLTTKEAVLSSRIEGTQASLGEVFRFEAGEEPKQMERRLDIQEIVNYRTALEMARHDLADRPFSLNLLKRLHSVLLDSVRGRNKARGRFRTTQNWIGDYSAAIEDARYVPPDPARIMELLDNWEKYYHCDEKDALVQLSIIHAQFEIIHPFHDGNGRLGRILVPLFLYEKQLLDRPIFYISAYLEEHRDTYIDCLRNLDNGTKSWHAWIEFFLRAVSEQAEKNTAIARSILTLYNNLKDKIIELTRSQFSVPLLDCFFHRPIFQSKHIDLGPNGPSYVHISNMLRTLREAGVLQVVRESSGRRPQVLMLHELVDLCEA